jgi:hypothetical protein
MRPVYAQSFSPFNATIKFSYSSNETIKTITSGRIINKSFFYSSTYTSIGSIISSSINGSSLMYETVKAVIADSLMDYEIMSTGAGRKKKFQMHFNLIPQQYKIM